MLRIDTFTIFPDPVRAWLSHSLIGRARERGLVDLRVHDIREASSDSHRSVDDTTFGGGAGMVLTPGPIFASVEGAAPPRPLFLLAPGERRLDQRLAAELATSEGFSLLCGRYEGVDQRVVDHLVDGSLSIGDFVLAGGELAALAVIEAVTRLVPGVMGNDRSSAEESFGDGLLEYPQYTRPAVFREWPVPEVLRSGDHGRIRRWRRALALARTIDVRPDLVESRGGVTEEERDLLSEWAPSALDRLQGSRPKAPHPEGRPFPLC